MAHIRLYYGIGPIHSYRYDFNSPIFTKKCLCGTQQYRTECAMRGTFCYFATICCATQLPLSPTNSILYIYARTAHIERCLYVMSAPNGSQSEKSARRRIVWRLMKMAFWGATKIKHTHTHRRREGDTQRERERVHKLWNSHAHTSNLISPRTQPQMCTSSWSIQQNKQKHAEIYVRNIKQTCSICEASERFGNVKADIAPA